MPCFWGISLNYFYQVEKLFCQASLVLQKDFKQFSPIF